MFGNMVIITYFCSNICDTDIVAVEVKSEENLQSKSLKAFHCENPDVGCLRTSRPTIVRRSGWSTFLCMPLNVISSNRITCVLFYDSLEYNAIHS